jgi:hypothetical protein
MPRRQFLPRSDYTEVSAESVGLDGGTRNTAPLSRLTHAHWRFSERLDDGNSFRRGAAALTCLWR